MNFTSFYIQHVLEHGVHRIIIIIIITFKNSHKECAIGGRGDACIYIISHCMMVAIVGGSFWEEG